MILKPSELAEALGVSKQMVDRNVLRENLEREGSGRRARIDLLNPKNHAWISNKYPGFYERMGIDVSSLTEKEKPEEKKQEKKPARSKPEKSSELLQKEQDKLDWEIRYKKGQALEKEIRNKKLLGELVEVSEVESLVDTYILTYKKMMKLELASMVSIICSELQADLDEKTRYQTMLKESIDMASTKALKDFRQGLETKAD